MRKNIAVIGGCGHIGLPLGLVFASKGFHVTLLDINENTVRLINEKHLPFQEEGAEELLNRHLGIHLKATTDPSILPQQDVIIIVTGTPVDEHLNPKVNDVLRILDKYLDMFRTGQLLIFRSTLYPGTVRLIHHKLLEARKDLELAFCPERILQGRGIQELTHLPQLVSGVTPEAEQHAAELFACITKEIIRLTPEEAELAKLMTNSWRYLEFAIANQFYMMAEEHDLDFYKIFSAMTRNYPRAAHFPKPGLSAGPCLFKDTMQLAAFHDNHFFLGHAAMLVNEGMPSVLVRQLKKKLGSLQAKKVAILGMTFKADNDDIRESLSFKIKKILIHQMAEVLASDPYLPETLPLEQALSEADGIIIGVPHSIYKNLQTEKPVVDCWNLLKQSNRRPS